MLTFSLAATSVTLLAPILETQAYFTAPGRADWTSVLFYLRLFTHVLGHAGWEHLLSNLAIILLLGPLLEEKHGAAELLEMIAITAVVTGVANVLLFDTGLLGASGVAFMMILLASAGGLKRGEIPLTFVLVAAIFLGREIYMALWKDQVSQFAHLIGGACGAAFGFDLRK